MSTFAHFIAIVYRVIFFLGVLHETYARFLVMLENCKNSYFTSIVVIPHAKSTTYTNRFYY